MSMDDGSLRLSALGPSSGVSLGDIEVRVINAVMDRTPELIAAEETLAGLVEDNTTLDDRQARIEKMKTLLAAMHRAKVPIVAGTDGFGIELVRELEIYVESGLTPADALATATLEPARLVGVEQRTGSIEVGKAADLVLVEGDPAKRIGDLRQTRVVMLDGKLMDADALRAAAGFAGRPKSPTR